jgi:hypothetical protein
MGEPIGELCIARGCKPLFPPPPPPPTPPPPAFKLLINVDKPLSLVIGVGEAAFMRGGLFPNGDGCC